MTLVRLEPAALRSRVKHSTTEPPKQMLYSCIIDGYKLLKSNKIIYLHLLMGGPVIGQQL